MEIECKCLSKIQANGSEIMQHYRTCAYFKICPQVGFDLMEYIVMVMTVFHEQDLKTQEISIFILRNVLETMTNLFNFNKSKH